MPKQEIKSLTLAETNVSFVVEPHLGIPVECQENTIVPVGRIEDKGLEWENSIDWIYYIYDELGEQTKEVVNCGVIVTYKKG